MSVLNQKGSSVLWTVVCLALLSSASVVLLQTFKFSNDFQRELRNRVEAFYSGEIVTWSKCAPTLIPTTNQALTAMAFSNTYNSTFPPDLSATPYSPSTYIAGGPLNIILTRQYDTNSTLVNRYVNGWMKYQINQLNVGTKCKGKIALLDKSYSVKLYKFAPPRCILSANPSPVVVGGTVTITLTRLSTGGPASVGTISNSTTSQQSAMSQSMTATFTQTTDESYSGFISGRGGQNQPCDNNPLLVRVTPPPPPTCSLTASPNLFSLGGGTTTLTISVPQADSNRIATIAGTQRLLNSSNKASVTRSIASGAATIITYWATYTDSLGRTATCSTTVTRAAPANCYSCCVAMCQAGMFSPQPPNCSLFCSLAGGGPPCNPVTAPFFWANFAAFPACYP